MIEVRRAGALTTVQDLGRFGGAHLGVPRSGALDEPAYRLANRLVGNPASAATLETTLTGVSVRTMAATVAAVTGAPAGITVDGRPAAWGVALPLAAGAVLDIDPATYGVRSYIAFAGGITVAPVLGSRSTDLLSGLGPPPLREGDRLPLGMPAGMPEWDWLPAPPAPPSELVLPLRLGPRADWFDSLDPLRYSQYTVAPASNRIGLRTHGPPLSRAVHRELPSEGMVLGAVQVPPDGLPIVLLADHPTTGGYPVVGVVEPEGLAAAAQARPGIELRFSIR